MNKLKNIIQIVRKFLEKVWHYVRIDGLLHFVCTALIFLTFRHIVSFWWAFLLTVLVFIAKEVYDRLSDKGSAEWHDVFCDLAGLLFAILVSLLPVA